MSDPVEQMELANQELKRVLDEVEHKQENHERRVAAVAGSSAQ